MRFVFAAILLLIPVLLAAPQAHAEETDFVIRVLARDAKFIGTSMGGAHVMIRDKRTGDLLVEGITSGTTGDTKKIMAENHDRDALLSDDKSANFGFSLDLFEPTPVTISATGPLAQTQSMGRISEDYILIPGKDYTSGDGIVLELPGFVVDIMSPPAGQIIKFDPEVSFNMAVNIAKMCGCRIEKDTPWDPERYEVEAYIYRNNILVTNAPFQYSGNPGIYITKVLVPQDGIYRMVVTAFDPKTREAGMDSTTIIVKPAE